MTARARARSAACLILGLCLLPASLASVGPARGQSPLPTEEVGVASPIPLPGASPAPTPGSTLPAGVGRPDMVVLLIDDLAQIDDRVWQRLPTIRELFLESGARFSSMIGNDPVCCPGRANLLTGQWSAHHGVIANDARLFDPRVTIATELQGAGYWTGIFGKYFNQTLRIPDKSPPGWDRSWIIGGNYWNYPAWLDGKRTHHGSADADYSTTVLQVRALEALRSAPAGRPRFLWLAPYAVHGGWDQLRTSRTIQPRPAPGDTGAPECRGIPPWSTAANFEFDMRDKPGYLQGRHLATSWDVTRTCETLLSVDRLLAAVLHELRAQGRPEPLVILTADNGMAWGAHRWLVKYVPYAAPVPFFLRWPRLLGETPVSVPTTVTNVDVAPTLCAIGGCRMGPFPNGHRADGIDLLPLLLEVGEANRGAAPGEVRVLASGVSRTADDVVEGLTTGRELVFIEHHNPEVERGVRPWSGLWTTDESPFGRWVYTLYQGGEEELYDVGGGTCWTWRPGDPGDPCQLRNVAADPAHALLTAVFRATLRHRAVDPLRLRIPVRLPPQPTPTASPSPVR